MQTRLSLRNLEYSLGGEIFSIQTESKVASHVEVEGPTQMLLCEWPFLRSHLVIIDLGRARSSLVVHLNHPVTAIRLVTWVLTVHTFSRASLHVPMCMA